MSRNRTSEDRVVSPWNPRDWSPLLRIVVLATIAVFMILVLLWVFLPN